MESNSNSLPPTSNIKASFDPGWNDPPTFSYNAQQTTPNRPRNFLNKRVAFPLSGATQAQSSTPPVSLPPMPTMTTTPPITNQGFKSPDEAFTVDSKEVLNEVTDILTQLLEQSTELGPKTNDIKKRLSVMEEMWSNGKLNNQVQIKMKELALALKNDDPSLADEIHRALMVDHVSSVGTWMPGVKQLILNHIARVELLAIDKE